MALWVLVRKANGALVVDRCRHTKVEEVALDPVPVYLVADHLTPMVTTGRTTIGGRLDLLARTVRTAIVPIIVVRILIRRLTETCHEICHRMTQAIVLHPTMTDIHAVLPQNFLCRRALHLQMSIRIAMVHRIIHLIVTIDVEPPFLGLGCHRQLLPENLLPVVIAILTSRHIQAQIQKLPHRRKDEEMIDHRTEKHHLTMVSRFAMMILVCENGQIGIGTIGDREAEVQLGTGRVTGGIEIVSRRETDTIEIVTGTEGMVVADKIRIVARIDEVRDRVRRPVVLVEAMGDGTIQLSIIGSCKAGRWTISDDKGNGCFGWSLWQGYQTGEKGFAYA